jgi:NhaA family Na+:H+ antiporter
MSLFIGSLAFVGLDPGFMNQVKIGVLGGSLLSGLAGAIILFTCRPASKPLASN